MSADVRLCPEMSAKVFKWRGLFTLANIPHLYSGCQVFQELFFRISSKGSLQMLLCFFRRQKYNIENAKSSVWRIIWRCFFTYLKYLKKKSENLLKDWVKLEDVSKKCEGEFTRLMKHLSNAFWRWNFFSVKIVVIVVRGVLSVYSSVISYDNDPCFSLSFVVRSKRYMTTNDKGFWLRCHRKLLCISEIKCSDNNDNGIRT